MTKQTANDNSCVHQILIHCFFLFLFSLKTKKSICLLDTANLMVGQGTSPFKKKKSPSLFGSHLCPSDLDGGRFFFNAVKEGDSVVFAADDEAESHLWVMALYRATGQSHKPAPPLTPATQGKSSTIAKIQGGRLTIAVDALHSTWRPLSSLRSL